MPLRGEAGIGYVLEGIRFSTLMSMKMKWKPSFLVCDGWATAIAILQSGADIVGKIGFVLRPARSRFACSG